MRDTLNGCVHRLLVWTGLALILLMPASADSFSDNFNRPDGAVGNDWAVWGNGADIRSGELETFGLFDRAGGVDRSLLVTFPVTFSFDFRTDSPSSGWQFGFNAANADQASTSELAFYQFGGSQNVCTEWQTSAGRDAECRPVAPGQRDYGPNVLANISGLINSDLSSELTITYNDGASPAAVTIDIPTPSGILTAPPGTVFVIGNSSANFGPHFFDNLNLAWGVAPVPEPSTVSLLALGLAALVLGRMKQRV